MKTKTYTVFWYEPGDRLKQVKTGKIYEFIEYGFCDTAAVKDKKGKIDTWGRKLVHDPECFKLIIDYSKVDPDHICPVDDCCSKLERDVQYEKKEKLKPKKSKKIQNR